MRCEWQSLTYQYAQPFQSNGQLWKRKNIIHSEISSCSTYLDRVPGWEAIACWICTQNHRMRWSKSYDMYFHESHKHVFRMVWADLLGCVTSPFCCRQKQKHRNQSHESTTQNISHIVLFFIASSDFVDVHNDTAYEQKIVSTSRTY